MFTPPPSPLPQYDSRRSSTQDYFSTEADDEEGEFEYQHISTSSSSSLSPPIPPPRKHRSGKSPLRNSISVSHSVGSTSKKVSSRRIWIPVIAVLLVLVGISSKFSVTSSDSSLVVDVPSHSDPSNGSLHNDVLRSRARRKRSAHLHHIHSHEKRQSEDDPDAVADRTKTSNDPPTPTASTADPLKLAALDASTSSSQPSTEDTPPSIPDPPFPVPTPFPQPFDTSFSYNFTTASCQTFFINEFLSNMSFRSCRAFSLLLPSSSQFFTAQDNLTTITSIMGGTCNTKTNVDECVQTMDTLAHEFEKDTVCGLDLKEGNSLVNTAVNGFKNYKLMRDAGCLVNQRTNTYCFADAVASSSPSDFYYYALPLGTPIPEKAQPSCSTCVQSLLSLYATQAGNSSMAISKTYRYAADLARGVCGNKYALSVGQASGSALVVEAGNGRIGLMWVGSVILGGLMLGLGSLSSLFLGGGL